jgi:hypothetical protein
MASEGENMTSGDVSQFLKDGAKGIDEWNRRHLMGDTPTDLQGFDLREHDLGRADLSGVDLSEADLDGTFLGGADLDRTILRGAHLRGAKLVRTNLRGTNLARSDLRGADFDRAILKWADLSGANLSGATLSEVDLYGVHLDQSNFSSCKCGHTIFADVDLSKVQGLNLVTHFAPSTIGADTIFRSQGRIPESFLRGCGIPEPMLVHIQSLVGALQPIQFYSCFISHSAADKEFARRLHSRMRDAGLRVWFDEEDMKAGRELHPQIDEAIRVYDKLLLVLSTASMDSKWVTTELRRARGEEGRDGVRKLFPIRLVDFELIKAWKVPESSGEDLAEEVRKFFILDFTDWKNHDKFEAGFAHLLRDLKRADGADYD